MRRGKGSWITCSGATTANPWPGGSQAQQPRSDGGKAAGRAVRQLPGAALRQAAADFLSNGYRHSLWDDRRYPPREVQGFYRKDELETLIRRREIPQPLAQATLSTTIAGRYNQQQAIRAICESLEQGLLKALLVQATGTGKTRTAISLTDVLTRCNWVKRVLFLADRTSPVLQDEGAFRRFLPDCSPVNLMTDKDVEGRVFLSTYPTMMNRIDAEDSNGVKRFGVGHFDLVIIDEAHRSVYQKYGAIFAYFDSLLSGLTATRGDRSQHLRALRS